MNRKYILYALFFIIVALDVLMAFNTVKLKENNRQIAKELDEEKSWNLKLDVIQLNKSYEMKSEDMNISNLFLLDTTSGYFFIKDKLSSEKQLVLYIAEENCVDCVDHVLSVLKGYYKNIGAEHIIILTNYLNHRHFLAFQKTLKMPIKAYNINGQKLNLPVETLDKPFFFILDNGLFCRQVFVPIKDIKDYTLTYLKDIQNRYWKEDHEQGKQSQEKK